MQRIKYETNTDKEEFLDYYGMALLVGALFRLTAQDLKFGNKRTKKNVQQFLSSEWFDCLCSGINVESSYVKKLILSSRVKTRSNYE